MEGLQKSLPLKPEAGEAVMELLATLGRERCRSCEPPRPVAGALVDITAFFRKGYWKKITNNEARSAMGSSSAAAGCDQGELASTHGAAPHCCHVCLPEAPEVVACPRQETKLQGN